MRSVRTAAQPRERGRARTVGWLGVSGLTELALGALLGWPYSLAVVDADKVRTLGIRSPSRLRQWHLDMILLGSLCVLADTALPELPRHVAMPLGVGAWTNAMSFGVLAVSPDTRDHPAYRTAVAGSFVTTSLGFTLLAREGLRRRLRASASSR